VRGVVKKGTEDIARAKDEYDARRKLVYQTLTAAGLKCGYPKGALYLMVDLGVDADAFTKFMLTDYSGIQREQETAMITPAMSFYKTPGQGSTQARIACVLAPAKLEKAMRHLILGLEEYKTYAK
jgi:aspartate/methionine/tyrosine aminotransferase